MNTLFSDVCNIGNQEISPNTRPSEPAVKGAAQFHPLALMQP